MSKDQTYPGANTTTQWYQDNFPGSSMDANVGILHSTEGPSWPGYSGGAVAPNITGKPHFGKKVMYWRQHFPVDKSSRALVNKSGGVETNTLNAFQVELVGTCVPAFRKTWKIGSKTYRANVDYIYWPEAPDWALKGIADLMVWLEKEHGIPMKSSVKWIAYPGSYANGKGQRLSNRQWLNYYGWCGHQHVPENVHGDPGNFPIARTFALAKGAPKPAPVTPPAPPKPAPAPPKPTPVPQEADEMACSMQRYSANDARGEFVITASGAVHLKNGTHRDLLVAEGRASTDLKIITAKQLSELLEKE